MSLWSCRRVERGKINLFGVILFMRWLLFLSRLAFICNVLFALTYLVQLTRWSTNQELEVTFVFIWYFMAMLLNPIVVICYVLLYFLSRTKLNVVPKWLIMLNTLFIFFQIYFIFHLNAQ
jgi:hypothetical protein